VCRQLRLLERPLRNRVAIQIANRASLMSFGSMTDVRLA